MQICSKVYCDRVYFLCTERIATAGADLAFLQGGGGGYFTSREASLAAQGGGGVKPYCLRLSLRQSAIGTYCVGLDIMMAFFYAH